MYENQKGITLIPLVITIIVMLILVGVTISLVVNGGLFEKAGEAVSKIQKKEDLNNRLENGKVQMNGIWYDSIDKYFLGEKSFESYPEYSTSLLNDTTGVLKENAKYTDKNKEVAVIPRGFKLTNDEDEIKEGIVITDKVDSQGNSIGNEFVWIPVKEGDFERTGWLQNNPSVGALSKSYIENLSTDPTKQYSKMVDSVNKYGGFYIGRYEAGSNENRAKTRKDETLLVKKGVYPYIYVMWGLEMNEYEGEKTNYGHGAVYLSKNMYTGNKFGVVSTLCYGVQWDAALRFIKDKVNVTDSTEWGNYQNNEFTFTGKYSIDSGKTWTEVTNMKKPIASEENNNTTYLLTTGASEENSVKNIYDLAGNVSEWTMEANSTYRVLRGGYYFKNDGSVSPASSRNRNSPANCSNYFGFRPALYIK